MKRLSARMYAQVLLNALNDASASEHVVIVQNFLRLLQRHRALKLFPRILEHIQQLEDQAAGRTRIRVRQAGDMTTAKLSAELKKHFGKVVLETTEDSSIQAGIQLRIGDTLIDASLATQLQSLRHQLAGE